MIPGRCAPEVIQIGVRSAAGGVHAAVEDLAKGDHAAGAGTGSQDHRADLRIGFDPAQFHGVVGVDDHNDFVEVGGDGLYQIPLGPGQLQIVLAFLKLVIGAGAIGVYTVVVELGTGIRIVGGNILLHPAALGHVERAVDNSMHVAGQVGVLAAAA